MTTSSRNSIALLGVVVLAPLQAKLTGSDERGSERRRARSRKASEHNEVRSLRHAAARILSSPIGSLIGALLRIRVRILCITGSILVPVGRRRRRLLLRSGFIVPLRRIRCCPIRTRLVLAGAVGRCTFLRILIRSSIVG